MLRQACGFPAGPLLSGGDRIALCSVSVAAAELLLQAVLPAGVLSLAVAGLAGLAVFAAAMDRLLLPGHLARPVALARTAIPTKLAPTVAVP